MRKICIVNHGLSSGGTDTFIINILKGLDKEKFDISLIMALNEKNTKQFREEEALAEGVHIYRTCDLTGIKNIFLHCKKLYRLFKATGPYDAVHGNMDLFNGLNLLTARLAGIKIRICHSHTSQSQYEAKTKNHFTVNLYRKIMRVLIWMNSTARCGCSPQAMDYLYGGKWHRDGRSMVVYNGIDLRKFSAEGDDRRILSNRTGIDLSNKNIVAVGNISEVKNPFFIINIVSELIKSDKTVRLIWVGTGELLPRVREYADESGIAGFVKFMGVRNDVDDILKCGDCFLLPSLFEGLSIALIEAQAAGLDCFVSDTIPPEANCGKCRYIPLQEGPKRWAEIINSHLNAEEPYRIDSLLLKRFDLNVMLPQLESLYEGN